VGVDWSDGPAQGPAHLAAAVSTDRQGGRVAAGETIHLRATVKNDGSGPARQLRAKIKSDFPLFDERELVFGKVGPGESKSADLPVKVPRSALTQIDDLKLEFTEAHGAKADSAELKVQIDGAPRPQFAYTYQVID